MSRQRETNIVLPDIPERLSNAELKNAFKGHCDASIMRGLIDAEIKYIRADGQRDDRTLRGFWYQVIKSALSRTGLLNKKTSKGKEKDWADDLSDYLEEMVSEGITSYEELRIIDGSRQRSVARPMSNTIVETYWVRPHYPWVIVFTEKDTIWQILASVAELYGVSYISCGGEPAASCTEDIIKKIVRSEAFKAHQPEAIYLLGITDYDPYGYHIFDAQVRQVKLLLPKKEVASNIEVKAIRLGVYPKQLSPEELSVKTYTPKKDGLDEWIKRTGRG